MKTAIKHENAEFTVRTLKHVSSLTVIVNLPTTPKPWLIAHEHGHKTRKRRVFGHKSRTCIGSYGRCKSPSNPKTVGNSSQKHPYRAKTTIFGHDSEALYRFLRSF
jgi:hypothetical protein